MGNPQRSQRGDTYVHILFPGMFLVFLALKLAGIAPVANWSWWWVTAPLWGGFVFGAVLVTGALVLALICSTDRTSRVPGKYKLRGPFR